MYNNYGLKWYDIVNLFSGEEDDFATPGMNSGRDNIEDEIELQSGKLSQKVPSNVLRLFEFVEYALMDQEKEYTSGVGTRFRFPKGITPLLTGEFTAYYTDKKNTCSSSSNLTLGSTDEFGCNNLSICTQATIVDVETVSGSDGAYYGITEDVNLEDKDLWVSYEVDSEASDFVIKELKACLRDMVACVLGGKLMLEGEQNWRLLDIVCATKFNPPKGWVPSEYKKLKWWRKPWQNGIASGKFWRG